MKKLLFLFCAVALIFAYAGNTKEQTATYQLIRTESGIAMTDTQNLKSKGDILYEYSEYIVIDMSNASDALKDFMIKFCKKTFANYEKANLDYVQINYELVGNTYTASLVVSMENADLHELIDCGIFRDYSNNVNPNATKLSFKQTCKLLENLGYIKQ